jgi:putative ABC transport system ATP-binding protein
MEKILQVTNVSKKFKTNQGEISILEDVSFVIGAGEKVAIIGPSGSGKSTLLSLIGLLDVPTTGVVKIAGIDIATLSEAKQAVFRNQKIGFIFQSFELISPFTVSENVSAPLEIGGVEVDKEAVTGLIAKIGLAARAEAMPYTLSGGEKQRVAIARALIQKPALILADEPTGSLDRATGEKVLSMLLESVSESKTTLIIITHDETIAARMDRVFELRDKGVHERL